MTAAAQVIVYAVAVAAVAFAAWAVLLLGIQVAHLLAARRIRRAMRAGLSRIGTAPEQAGPFAEIGRAFEQIRDALGIERSGEGDGGEEP